MGFSRRAPGFLFCQNFFKILPLYPPARHGKIVRVKKSETGGMGVNWLRKLSAMLLCLMLCLGLFSGCGSDVYIAKLALSGTAGTFDPQFAENQNSILVASNAFEGLLVEDPDGGLHPGVAEGYTVSSDGAPIPSSSGRTPAGRTAALSPPMTLSLPSGGCSARGVYPPMPRICSRCRMPRPFSPGRCSPRHWASGPPMTTPWC